MEKGKSLYQYYVDRCNEILKNKLSIDEISMNHFSETEFEKCINILLGLDLIEKVNEKYKLSELGKEITNKGIVITITDIETDIILKQ